MQKVDKQGVLTQILDKRWAEGDDPFMLRIVAQVNTDKDKREPWEKWVEINTSAWEIIQE